MQKILVTDTDARAFSAAVEEAEGVVAELFELGDAAREGLAHILFGDGPFHRMALLYREGGRRVGYHFVTFERVFVDGRAVCVCRSLAGMRPGYGKGQQTLADVLLPTLMVKARVGLPLYLVTVCATPMGYKALANATPALVPSRRGAGDAETEAVLGAALARWGTRTELRDGVRVAPNVPCRIPFRRREGTPDVDFYLRHCPDFRQGLGLPVCAPLTLGTLLDAAGHVLRRRAAKTLAQLRAPALDLLPAPTAR